MLTFLAKIFWYSEREYKLSLIENNNDNYLNKLFETKDNNIINKKELRNEIVIKNNKNNKQIVQSNNKQIVQSNNKSKIINKTNYKPNIQNNNKSNIQNNTNDESTIKNNKPNIQKKKDNKPNTQNKPNNKPVIQDKNDNESNNQNKPNNKPVIQNKNDNESNNQNNDIIVNNNLPTSNRNSPYIDNSYSISKDYPSKTSYSDQDRSYFSGPINLVSYEKMNTFFKKVEPFLSNYDRPEYEPHIKRNMDHSTMDINYNSYAPRSSIPHAEFNLIDAISETIDTLPVSDTFVHEDYKESNTPSQQQVSMIENPSKIDIQYDESFSTNDIFNSSYTKHTLPVVGEYNSEPIKEPIFYEVYLNNIKKYNEFLETLKSNCQGTGRIEKTVSEFCAYASITLSTFEKITLYIQKNTSRIEETSDQLANNGINKSNPQISVMVRDKCLKELKFYKILKDFNDSLVEILNDICRIISEAFQELTDMATFKVRDEEQISKCLKKISDSGEALEMVTKEKFKKLFSDNQKQYQEELADFGNIFSKRRKDSKINTDDTTCIKTALLDRYLK